MCMRKVTERRFAVHNFRYAASASVPSECASFRLAEPTNLAGVFRVRVSADNVHSLYSTTVASADAAVPPYA